MLRKQLSGPERLRIAAEVGSDLPLFLVGGTVLGVGRGEEVYPLPDLRCDSLRGGDSGDWSFDSEGFCGLGFAGRGRTSGAKARILGRS